jgi:hypothetical protein
MNATCNWLWPAVDATLLALLELLLLLLLLLLLDTRCLPAVGVLTEQMVMGNKTRDAVHACM